MGRKSKVSEYNEQVRIANKEEVRIIEKEYVNNELKGLENAILAKRKEIEEKLMTYCEKNMIKRYTKDGTEYEVPNTNPLLIQKYFFQSINPLVNVEPMYSAEKLGIIWQLYEEMIGKINAEIGMVVPNLSHFCSFAGIRVSTFKSFKNSPDEDMRVVAEKIEDGCYDSNVTLAQMGYLKERTTVYRMKSEQEKVEREQPVVHIHSEGVNLTQINQRINQLKGFSEKKRAIEADYNEPKGKKL